MTAPLFHLSPGSLDDAAVGSSLTIGGSEGHHAATVMRLGRNEHVQLSDTQHRRAEGVVVAAAAGELTVELLAVHQEPAPKPQLILVQALAKDKRDLQAVESATELGVDGIIPWHAERSVAKWKTGREEKKHAEWVNTVTTAAKQTRRTRIPSVESLHTTAQYARLISQLTAEGHHGRQGGVVVLHEADNRPLRQVLTELGILPPGVVTDHGEESGNLSRASGPTQTQLLDELHLVIGPEGGISDYELEALTTAGAQIARLGPTVLRSSTAGPAAVSGTQLLLGRWE